MSGCNGEAVNDELSVQRYSHFVWEPGVRRQGDFKRYFRPNREGNMSDVSTAMPANKYRTHLGIN